MNDILKILGVIKKIDLTIEIEKSDFIKYLSQKVKPNGLIFLDVLDNDKKEFYGNVSSERFWLRESSKGFSKSPFASARGIIKDSENKTSLDIKIIGWNWFILFWLLCTSFIFGNILIEKLIIPVVMILVMYLILLFKIRKGVKKLELYLISEFNKF